MSKFIDNLEAKLTPGGAKPIRHNLPELTATISRTSTPWDFLDEYKVKVEYAVVQHCKPEEVPEMLKMIRRKLQEEVFGEFRAKLIQLQQSIYGDDRQQSIEILRVIFDEIER
jgi:hypothetical protein